MRSTSLTGSVVIALCLGSADPNAARRHDSLDPKGTNGSLLQRSTRIADTYVCTVKAAASVGDDGSLKPEAAAFYGIGKTFTVDRKTGVYRGSVGTNASGEKREVVFVPPDNAFYVASTSRGPNTSPDYLAVQEFAPGSSKPFLLATFSYVISGTCE